MRLSVVVLAVLLALGAACKREGESEWDADEVSYELIAVDEDALRLTRGSVGVDRFRSEASYVLVDARNTYERDLLVTLGGDLVDERGEVVAELRRQSLRVPGGGGVRMFSLIDEENKVRPRARRARVEVRGAMKVGYEESIVVTDGRVDIDQDRAVVAGNIVNNAEREGVVIVFGAFYDEDGRPMKQTSTKLKIAGGGKRGIQFVGPAGSRKATLYTGKAVF